MKEIEKIFKKAKEEGRNFLLEPEGYFILEKLKINVPKYIFLKLKEELKKDDLEKIKSEKIVLKIVSSKILHKSDVGGVLFLEKDYDEIIKNISVFEKKFKEKDGFLICEMVEYKKEFGTEILIGTKLSNDFGPILTIGFGGILTEFYAKNFKSVSIFSPLVEDENLILKSLKDSVLGKKLWGKMRGEEILVDESIFLNYMD